MVDHLKMTWEDRHETQHVNIGALDASLALSDFTKTQTTDGELIAAPFFMLLPLKEAAHYTKES